MIAGCRLETMVHAILFTSIFVFGIAAANADDAFTTVRQDAETRAAIAAAERAQHLARLPPATSKPLSGAVELRQFGAAGLVKAFDLARQLAGDVCSALPADRKTSV